MTGRSVSAAASPLNAGQLTCERKLLAPILVTPTKPLTPSHIKAFLWFDVLYKATSMIHDVVYLYNRRTYDIAYQTLAFWIDLDSRYPEGFDFAHQSEVWIGERYVEFHRSQKERPTIDRDVLAEYRRRVEEDGWIHPASRRVLELWTQYYDLLHLDRPALDTSQPLECSADEALRILDEAGLILDQRGFGGPVFLDLTDQGIPLRQLVDEHGQDNYVLATLRALLPIVGDYDSVALLCDRELDLDYLLIERALQRLGFSASRRSLGRVPLDGRVQSSRGGGWQNYTFDKIADRFLETFSIEAFRLGMRLYFIASLGASDKQSFCFDQIEQSLKRAERLLAKPSIPCEPSKAPPAFLYRFADRYNGYVDPYQLTAGLLSRKRPIDPTAVLPEVFL